jgi:hypothetical protein
MQDLDDGQRAILAKVEKLLRLADKNENPEEAASAAAKANELLVAYNLDAALLDQSGAGDSGKRADEKLRGGHHKYSQDLWTYVADLNFCLYWPSRKVVHEPKGQYRTDKRGNVSKTFNIYRWHHRIVGRKINVEATKQQAQYLEATVERLVRERIGNQARLLFSRFAHSFRKGAIEAITLKLWERREHLVSEERRKREEEARRAMDKARAGHSTATGLTIADVRKSERDANMDFIMGDGWSARKAAKRAEEARIAREAEETYARWAAAHPEEAAKAAAEARKEEERREKRKARRAPRERREKDNLDWSAYNAGYAVGEKISIDPQVDGAKKQERLTHG